MPVIRLSPDLFKRLEDYVLGFDTPQNVIERILDYLDSNNLKDEVNRPGFEINRNISQPRGRVVLGTKKARDPQKETRLKLLVGKSLNWGKPNLMGSSVLTFPGSEKRVLCKYSSFSGEQRRWFWGVSKRYWIDWRNTDQLALLLQNEDLESYSYILLTSKEASELFTMCSESNGEKKINLRQYSADGKLHLQEWQEFDAESRITSIDAQIATQ